jgi:predicted O-linked N-acetylglucosamine transferase (SPINDLY family)
MAILRQTGDSILSPIDDNQWSCRNLRRYAAAAGVDPARLIFADRIGPAAYLARLTLADLYLDTFPYNAGVVASGAIRMGLPLLTRVGQSFASRMGARMLHAIGADDGIAESLEHYVAKAIDLASAPKRYAVYRAHFTADIWARTIGDVAGFTQKLEAILLRIRRRPAELSSVVLHTFA